MSGPKQYILVINAGSTSTRVSIYWGETLKMNEILKHPAKELLEFPDVWDQYDYRKQAILSLLSREGFMMEMFSVIVSRGGTVKPIPGGIYHIDQVMLQDMKSKIYGSHPTNVGSQVAFDLAGEAGIPAITVDPPVTDEMSEMAKFSGIPQILRQSSFHALSQKATARKAAAVIGKAYGELNLIVIHLGGGISVGAHQGGRVVDVNNALNGDGPFSPERAGTLPTGELINLCYSGIYSRDDMYRIICGKGGLMAYLGTTDVQEIERRITSGDQEARKVFEAMAYQVAKETGAAAAVLAGEVDGIVLTGSMAHSKSLVELIQKQTAFIGPFYLFPGENEMEALAAGALRYLSNQEQPQQY